MFSLAKYKKNPVAGVALKQSSSISLFARSGGNEMDNMLGYQSMDRWIDPTFLRSFG